jgi:hypothetical protein
MRGVATEPAAEALVSGIIQPDAKSGIGLYRRRRRDNGAKPLSGRGAPSSKVSPIAWPFLHLSAAL